MHPFYGQQDSAWSTKNQIKLSPVRLVTIVPGLLLSYERQFSEKFATQVSVGYLTGLLRNNNDPGANLSGLMAGIEQKYYFNNKKHTRDYYSADVGFLHCDFDMVHRFRITNEGGQFTCFL